MAEFDVQIVMQGSSDLPEDRYVNTLYFDTGPGTGASELASSLGGIYEPFVQEWIGGVRALTVNVYTPGMNPGGPEAVNQRPVTTGQPGPHEVALCLSYYAGTNQPRNRGRIYAGPFVSNGIAGSRPGQALVDSLLDLGEALSGAGPVLDGTSWQQRSATTGARRTVTDIWVDNAWDTQRRRGAAPTARSVRSV